MIPFSGFKGSFGSTNETTDKLFDFPMMFSHPAFTTLDCENLKMKKQCKIAFQRCGRRRFGARAV
jgi:hypothetical protein